MSYIYYTFGVILFVALSYPVRYSEFKPVIATLRHYLSPVNYNEEIFNYLYPLGLQF